MSDLNSLSTAFKAVQAWKMATASLAVICTMLAYGLVKQANDKPVVLLPYESAISAGDKMVIPTNGSFKNMDISYIGNIAYADIGLLLNYVPENVIKQRNRFITRLTADTATTFRQPLQDEAIKLKNEGKSQSFAPLDIVVLPNTGQVRLTGKLIRTLGGQVVLNTTITYLLTYKSSQGYLHVSEIKKVENQQ